MQVEAVVLVCGIVGSVSTRGDGVAVGGVGSGESVVDQRLLDVVIAGVDWVLSDTAANKVSDVLLGTDGD